VKWVLVKQLISVRLLVEVPAELELPNVVVLDASAGFGDALVAPFLCVRERLVLAAFALDEHAPARTRQPRFAFAIDVALVGQYDPAGVGRVQHVLEVIGVVLARCADLELADQLVALVRIGRELVTEIGLAVLLRPARLDVLLAPLRRRPVGGHGVVLDDRLLFLVQALFGTWTMLASMIWPPRAIYPWLANWRLTASNTLSLAPALIHRP